MVVGSMASLHRRSEPRDRPAVCHMAARQRNHYCRETKPGDWGRGGWLRKTSIYASGRVVGTLPEAAGRDPILCRSPDPIPCRGLPDLGSGDKTVRVWRAAFSPSIPLMRAVPVQCLTPVPVLPQVTVTLSDGSTITGAALLACDGIHSAVRRALYNSASPPAHISPSLAHAPDHLRFSGINVWWGKCTLHRDSEAYGLVARTQTSRYGSYTLVWCLGSPGHPGTFVGSPVASTDDALVCAWAFCAPADLLPSGVGDDLTCRGAVSGPAAKTDLERHTRGLSPLIRAVVRATDADAVRKVGVHVRERTDLPYAVGRVALLGDAAHPQSPFLGQGVNMALADAYVCAERLARQPVPTALRTYAAAARREAVNALLKQSDWLGATLMSGGWVTTLMVHSLVKRGPVLRWLLLDPEEIDMSNRAMVEEATRELGLDFDPLPAAERPSEWGPGCGAEECTAARQA